MDTYLIVYLIGLFISLGLFITTIYHIGQCILSDVCFGVVITALSFVGVALLCALLWNDKWWDVTLWSEDE